jgi:FK506-binding nuclear protein
MVSKAFADLGPSLTYLSAQTGKRKAETQTPQPDAKKAKTASAAASALKPAEKATPAAVPVKDAKKPADSAKATPAQKTPADKGTPATAPKGQDARGAKDSKQSTPSGASESGDKEPKKKTLPSGLSIEDKIVGSGAKAKNGKTLAVRYIGKLANGKVFDSNTSGNPFKIQLGKGSVIKGWEVGLQGMNAGGTRVLTIPPNLAYGMLYFS